jgi:dephospho-CoA kinase
MLVVGLTGGIGSGKSSVAALFAQRGAPIIDADVIAREVTAPDKPAFASIVKHFGPEIISQDGGLDRAKLRGLIFSDAKQRFWLEKLLHPSIRDEMQQQILALSTPYCIAVIPLLLEVEFYSFINRILVVDASETDQIQRVIARDHTSKADVETIISSQAHRQDRRAKAHDVIINDGKPADLIPQVDKLHAMYTQLGLQKM